jgi:6-phosphogluconolactonase (cycloisomerase 2 family)
MEAAKRLRAIRITALASAILLIAIEITSCGGGNSASSGSRTVDNPAPGLQSISPTTATLGQAGFALIVLGSGYVSNSTVLWNGTSLSTTFVNANKLTANVAASNVATAGTVHVQVSSPSPGGGESSIANFQVDNPAPSLVSLSPANATAGGTSFKLTLSGSSFVPGASVLWNDAALTTTLVNSGQLTAQISAGEIASAGIAQVTVSNPTPGGGNSPILRFGITSAAAVQEFLYASNFANNTVSGYSVDSATGVLTEVPDSPFVAEPTAGNPGSIIADRFGTYLSLINTPNSGCKGCSSVSIFSTNTLGGLTPITGSPFSSPYPSAFVADSTGNYIYESQFSLSPNTGLLTMLIDASSGALKQVASSLGFVPFSDMVVNAADTYLYGVTGQNFDTNGVQAAAISPTTGAVTPINGSPFGSTAFSTLAINPAGTFLFAVDGNINDVGFSTLASFVIDTSTGVLTLVNSSQYSGKTLGAALVHPSGSFLYVLDQGDYSIMAFAIGVDVTLTPITGSPFSVGESTDTPLDLAIDAQGQFLYVVESNQGIPNSTGFISGFTIDASSGVLTPISGSPFSDNDGGPASVVVSP